MKHITLLLGWLAVLPASAQLAQRPHLRLDKEPLSNGAVHAFQGIQRDAGTALWTEDFENGLGDWTVNTPAGAVSWQLTSTGNTSGYTPGPLQSTSGHPGGSWIVADSDLQGTAGISETSTITSPPITGLDTVAFMLLQFEQSFRQLNDDQTIVEVSGNGGLNWTAFPVNTAVPGNQSTPGAPGAETVTLNISNALNGGASDIRIRFRWHSDEGYTYSWQVDDLMLYAAEENDLTLLRATWSAWDLDEPDLSGLPYTVYPENEVRPLNFRGQVTNNGSQTQTNVRLQVAIDGPGSNDITLTSTSITLAPTATDSLFITSYAPPAVSGPYAITMTVLQDEAEQAADDNTSLLSFHVDPHTFARDGGTMETDFAKGTAEYILGNWFHITGQNNELTAVQVALSDRSEAGAVITVAVYDGALDQLQESEEHTVQEADLNTIGGDHFITIPLSGTVDLLPGEAYFVAVHHFGGAQEVWTGVSGTSAEQTSLVYDGQEADWFYTRSTPMVRMSFDPTASTLEHATDPFGLTAMPSLFDEGTAVRFTLGAATPVRWSLIDLSGRTVATQQLGTLAPGLHQVGVDGEGLAPGAYLFTVDSGTQRAVVRLVRSDVH